VQRIYFGEGVNMFKKLAIGTAIASVLVVGGATAALASPSSGASAQCCPTGCP
jgi:hypothetical protein